MRCRYLFVGIGMVLAIGAFRPVQAVDYKLPWSGGQSFPCTQGNNSSFSHTGLAAYAWDFGMSVGSEVVAAADGTVVLVREGSNRGGADRSYAGSANYVVVGHAAKRYSAYLHLQYNGVEVEVGNFVRQGQLIAYSGNTGYSTGPHLHFQVQVSGEGSFTQSVPIFFSDVLEDGGIPRSGRTYTSGNYFDPTRPIDPTVNRFPVFVSSPVTWAVAGRRYTYDMDAIDFDGDPLMYKLIDSVPWLSVDPISGLLSGIVPSELETSIRLVVGADDGQEGTGRQMYTVQILQPPRPPIGLLAIPTEDESGIALTWGPSPDDIGGGPIVGYRIYRGERPDIAEGALLDSTASGIIQYIDDNVPSRVSLYYWVQAVDKQGVSSDPVGTEGPITGVELSSLEVFPRRYALDQNVPNPFNGETNITYQLAETGPVTLILYTATGQRVCVLVDEKETVGCHRIQWNGLNEVGQPVASGVYICVMRASTFSAVRRMMLVR